MASSELAFSSAESLSAGSAAERGLVERCRRGDPQAFARLVALHEGMVFNLAARLLGDPEEARDIAQDVFLQVYRTLAALRGPEHPEDLDLPHRRQPVPQPAAVVAAAAARAALPASRRSTRRRRGAAVRGRARAEGPFERLARREQRAPHAGGAAAPCPSTIARSCCCARSRGCPARRSRPRSACPMGTVKSRLARARDAPAAGAGAAMEERAMNCRGVRGRLSAASRRRAARQSRRATSPRTSRPAPDCAGAWRLASTTTLDLLSDLPRLEGDGRDRGARLRPPGHGEPPARPGPRSSVRSGRRGP